MLEEEIIASIRTVFDPELPINLYDLGLIYAVEVDEQSRDVHLHMTLTTPNCPVAEWMPGLVRDAVAAVEGVNEVTVELVWDPPWTSDLMSDDARSALDMMGISWKDPGSGPTIPGVTGLTVGRTDNRKRGL